MYGAINWAFQHAPNSLVYWQHRLRRGHRIQNWVNTAYYIIHIPKTGGQSIAEAYGFLSPGHFVYSDLPSEVRERLRAKPHLAVIRCPLARIRSTFRYAVMLRERFPTTSLAGLAQDRALSTFVKSLPSLKIESHYFLRPAVGFFRGAPLDRLHLIPFEHLQAGIDEFHDKLGIERIRLPHKNRTEDVIELDVSLDEEAEAVLRQLYGADFDLYEAINDRPLSVAVDHLGDPAAGAWGRLRA